MNPQQQQPQQFPPQPEFGYPTAQNPYPMNKQPASKKTIYMMLGGGLLVLLLLIWLVFGGKSTPGQADMQKLVQNTSDSVGILDKYQAEVGSSATKNDLALAQIILRGNLQKLNELYIKTYKPKKKFSSSPQPDKASISTLDNANRDNQLDSKILEVLKAKVTTAYTALQATKKNFTSKSSLDILNATETDLKSVSEILNNQ